jgi:hypothetical protein
MLRHIANLIVALISSEATGENHVKKTKSLLKAGQHCSSNVIRRVCCLACCFNNVIGFYYFATMPLLFH